MRCFGGNFGPEGSEQQRSWNLWRYPTKLLQKCRFLPFFKSWDDWRYWPRNDMKSKIFDKNHILYHYAIDIDVFHKQKWAKSAVFVKESKIIFLIQVTLLRMGFLTSSRVFTHISHMPNESLWIEDSRYVQLIGWKCAGFE